MKITELLKLLEKEYDQDCVIRIFSDGSGDIEAGVEIAEFNDEEDMQEVLNKLYVELQETSKIKFEL